ncbi:3-oxoacyl-[acyl-carrier-protein] synthase 2 [Thermobispora bispora]|uniref:3-oxoacyl-[acyl-carrier-protein] synthase 2 n=1 Tax=Thermobispora bispora (strain ATCC 19993 / DSM 43833 / CBS 139.67 / JCM 10125 / KCTC 9307 / NBRC 14880 / R51) TaxID=469371 RepID=D6Y3X5_THEBD|nr:beta-ketoacyl-ACP synthase II [Thermobispora bispora]ADG89077.1 3-oxoacyl-(acyl-carrier-protein) synthase 2 [Thermobispora bispora DSM 43833]MBO2474366.1 beta-ketoacyl-[acyl-carrier-protein] synthase II [Actinomycetales bacterium]MBX6167737.1 beta-ketoacyl-ACP synthase II [Thermobispora bispora]QSI48798.1 beta-ketoacyl-[acyl-carrier-protein] synthase II [Thermobispora bispora]
MSKDRVRVVVTGLGATTPLGGDVASTWSALLEGRSGIRTLTEDWVDSVPVKFAGVCAVDPGEVLPRPEARRLDRTEQLALIAAREAWRDAGSPEVDPDRLGVVVGSGIGGITTILSAYDTFKEKGWTRLSPFTVPMLMPNGSAGWISIELNARAGAHAVASACATGGEAVAYAIDMIRSGRADVVVAGGTEAAIHPLNIASFAAARAMSTRNDEPQRASRPFDRDRDGFVLGEGAGILVLESEEHARARGARIYAVAAGVGYSADAHHITQPEQSAAGIMSAMRRALEDASLTGADVHHVNAHATSTPAGDVLEAIAINKVIGSHPLVTATKSMTGHLLGGAGGIESVFTVRALSDRIVPPTINIDNLDDGIEVDVVRGGPRKLPDGPIAALNNSFGFGGHNVAVAFTTA